MVTRRITFRLYPSKAQNRTLYQWRRMHKDLYNAAVVNRKVQYKHFGHSVSYLEQQNCLPAFKEVWPEYKALGSQALQATLKRVDLAFQSFFKGLRGYPKFKSIRHYSGWTYPATSGWKAHTTGKHGFLELTNLGQIRMRGEARTWGRATTCTIVHRNGKWYASITVDCTPVRATGTGMLTLDLGVETAITTFDGQQHGKIENPRLLKQSQGKVKRAERRKRRKRAPNRKQKVKASKRWKKAQQQVSRLKRQVANQRQNWVHQVTTQIVRRHSMVGTEKLNVKNMTRKAKKGSKRKRQKAGLNRSVLDVGFGMILSALKYKLSEVEGGYIEIPTQTLKPSQRCTCGELVPKTLSDRWHHCGSCGKQGQRDEVTTEVIWHYIQGTLPGLGISLAKRGSQVPTSAPQATGGWKQTWEKKRQKPPVA